MALQGIGLSENADPEVVEELVNEFIEKFNDDGDKQISKEEWLQFYGELYDSIIEMGISH